MSAVIIDRPVYPSLLLSPDGSRDKNGPVDPTVGSGVAVVPGENGGAWDFSSTTGVGVQLPIGDTGIQGSEGTLLVRYRLDSDTTQNVYVIGSGAAGESRFTMSTYLESDVASGYRIAGSESTHYNVLIAGERYAWTWHTVRWNGANIDHVTPLASESRNDANGGPFTGTLILSGAAGGLALVESMLIYDTALTDTEIERITSMGAWTWDDVGRRVTRQEELQNSLPRNYNRQAAIETVIYETDRNNQARIPLTGWTSVETDWDIDRAGSKSRIDIATNRRILRDYQWIAPVFRIIPEVGDIVEQQMGHFLLNTPSTTLDRTVDRWGDDVVQQTASGTDIMDIIAKAGLTESFYTPVKGHVMSDVAVLLKMATAGMLGPNLIEGHGFENNGAGWSVTASNVSPITTWVSEYPTPEGKNVFRPLLPAGTPAGAFVVAYSATRAVPRDSHLMMVSGISLGDSRQSTFAYIEFHDGTGWMHPDTRIHAGGTGNVPNLDGYKWRRSVGAGEVPDGALTFRVAARVQVITSSPTSTLASQWDDVQVRTCTAMPIPDSRIRLPLSDAVASTRIQTDAGDSILYQAINEHRLGAISHHAAFTDLTGVITSAPTRELGSATVARQYTSDDYRFIGAAQVERSADNRYNVVVAVKESFEEGTDPMVVTVWNDNPSDPWSVYGELGNVSRELLVQDAVDEAALEDAARAMLARAMEQHTLTITVRPDPTLAIHDVIEIVDGPEEAQGRWLIEFLRPGLMANDPAVEIGARRSSSSIGVSS